MLLTLNTDVRRIDLEVIKTIETGNLFMTNFYLAFEAKIETVN